MEELIISPITIKPVFHIGQIVFLITDSMQDEYIVTAFRVENRDVKYFISHSHNSEIECADFEISNIKIIK